MQKHLSLQNKITDAVIHHHSRRLLKMDILMFETCWANISEIKTTSDIKLVFNSSTNTYLLHIVCTINLNEELIFQSLGVTQFVIPYIYWTTHQKKHTYKNFPLSKNVSNKFLLHKIQHKLAQKVQYQSFNKYMMKMFKLKLQWLTWYTIDEHILHTFFISKRQYQYEIIIPCN